VFVDKPSSGVSKDPKPVQPILKREDERDSDDGTLWQVPFRKQLTIDTGSKALISGQAASKKPPTSPLRPNKVTWTLRPSTEEIIPCLDDYFPDHDVDKPIIDTIASGVSYTTQLEQAVPSGFHPLQSKQRHRKSIKAVAAERALRIGASKIIPRARVTKLWGSKMEEVGSSPETTYSPPDAANQKCMDSISIS